ncbi:hypothetical protein ACH79_10890 [Bradyrhizobium sp. CCBAU 051011]|nr:hypothetical protein ACH79_10890 [Bradyrhizobium sp. CCBAU 051011]
MTLSLLLELNRPAAPYALDRRCVADVAKCLRCSARNGRDENRVNETLTEHGQEKWKPASEKTVLQT